MDNSDNNVFVNRVVEGSRESLKNRNKDDLLGISFDPPEGLLPILPTRECIGW